MMLHVILVDDELPARDELRSLLTHETGIQIDTECSNALDAIRAIHQYHPDVVFLDIQMPRISGLEMVSMLDPDQHPAIVFITAYDEFAIQAFEQHAVDYLLKPIEPERLRKTIQRLHRLSAHTATTRYEAIAALAPLQSIPCYGHNRIYLIPLQEVEYIASDVAGIRVCGIQQSGITQLTLRTLEERTGFIRCHRQYLLNPHHVQELCWQDNGNAEIITNSQQHVPVSRRYLKPLKQALNIPA
jgi:two-component system LytT family response regulator